MTGMYVHTVECREPKVLETPNGPLTTICLQEQTMAADKFIRKEDSLFWAKVNKTETCWLWTAYMSRDGYGFMGRWINGKIKCFKAHKYSWLLNRGPVPDGLNVLHKCHVRHCVNPDHLYLGTQKDNARDAKERFGDAYCSWIPRTRGEDHPASKLTDGKVREIRRRIAAGEVQASLAKEFGVSKALICLVHTRKIWGHVEP